MPPWLFNGLEGFRFLTNKGGFKIHNKHFNDTHGKYRLIPADQSESSDRYFVITFGR